jgi:hypothetical protein
LNQTSRFSPYLNNKKIQERFLDLGFGSGDAPSVKTQEAIAPYRDIWLGSG